MSWWEGVEVAAWHRGWIKEWDPKFPRVSLLVGWSRGAHPGKVWKPRMQEMLSQVICNAIKISDLPELCLFADVSEEKVPIYSMHLNVFEVGRASSVGCAYRLVDGRGFGPHARHILSWRFGHEKKFMIFSPFKKGSCQLLAKEYILSTCKLPRRLAQEVWIG